MEDKYKKLDLDTLEKMAFPDHPISLVDLRVYAYSKEFGDLSDGCLKIEKHIADCRHCQKELIVLRASNPILNGEDDKKLKVLIEIIPEKKK